MNTKSKWCKVIAIMLHLLVLDAAQAVSSGSNDPRQEITERMEVFVAVANSDNSEALYEMMGPLLKSGITKSNFSTLLNRKWEIRSVLLVNHEIYDQGACLVAKIVEYDGRDVISSFRVWFWKRLPTGVWVPQNFPFAGAGVPNFVSTPDCLRSGF